MEYIVFLLVVWCFVSSVAFRPSWSFNRQRASKHTTFKPVAENFVGGMKESIAEDNLDNPSPNRLVSVANGEQQQQARRFDKDAAIFKYINLFLRCDLYGQDEEVVRDVRKEAEFYNITELVKYCDRILELSTPKTDNPPNTVPSSVEHVDSGIDLRILRWGAKNSSLKSATYALFSPYVREGQLEPSYDDPIEQRLNATMEQIHSEEAAAGHPTDAVVLDAGELEKRAPGLHDELIKKAKLEIETAADQWRKLYDYPFQLREVIALYPGGSFERSASPVRNATHVATMVLSLPCSYTGGDLEITHRNRSFSAEAGDTYWTAVSSDCGVRTLPVTSGVRLLALIDIHKSDLEQNPLYRVFELSESLYFGDGVNRDFTPDSIDPTAAAEFRTVLEKELETYSDAMIGLQGGVHYRTGWIQHPRRLRGRDRVYYVALKDHYDLNLVYTRVARMEDHRDYQCTETTLSDDYDPPRPPGAPRDDRRRLVVLPDGLTRDMSIQTYELQPGEVNVWDVAGLRLRRRQSQV